MYLSGNGPIYMWGRLCNSPFFFTQLDQQTKKHYPNMSSVTTSLQRPYDNTPYLPSLEHYDALREWRCVKCSGFHLEIPLHLDLPAMLHFCLSIKSGVICVSLRLRLLGDAICGCAAVVCLFDKQFFFPLIL